MHKFLEIYLMLNVRCDKQILNNIIFILRRSVAIRCPIWLSSRFPFPWSLRSVWHRRYFRREPWLTRALKKKHKKSKLLLRVQSSLSTTHFVELTVLHQLETLVLRHLQLVLRVHVAVHVRRTGTAYRDRLSDAHTTYGNAVDLTALLFIPSRHQDPCHQGISIVVAYFAEHVGGRFHQGLRSELHSVKKRYVS